MDTELLRRTLREAVKLLKAGRLDDARDRCYAILADEPGQGTALHVLGLGSD